MNYLKTIKDNFKNAPKGVTILLLFYYLTFAGILLKTIELFKEIFKLIQNWELPEKIGIYENVILKIDNQDKIIILFCLLVATLISYLFVIVSIIKLIRVSNLFSDNEVLVFEASKYFKSSARFFGGFILITIGLNIYNIILTDSLQGASNSLSIITAPFYSNTLIYIVIYATLLLISDILDRGFSNKELNEGTI